MSLDIHLSIENDDAYYNAAEKQELDLSKLGLSKLFCHLVFEAINEDLSVTLNKVGKIAKVDVLPLIKMAWYCDELDMKSQLGLCDDEYDRQVFIGKVQKTNAEVINNIYSVSVVLDELISNLSKTNDLLEQLRVLEANELTESNHGEYYF